MTPEIIAMLEQEDQPENIKKLAHDIRAMLKYSRSKIKKKYNQWDKNLKIFKGERLRDEEDLEAAANSEPEKLIVPTSYTQSMTFATFAYMLLKQNETFFPIETNDNDLYQLSETNESVLERDLRHNQFSVKLFQMLLDLVRFGFAATKTTWKVKKQTVMVPVVQPEAIQLEGMPFSLPQETNGPTETEEEVIAYEGNEIINISPYRIIPDMRLPLTRWAEGQFVADEYTYHINHFKMLESEGAIVGANMIRKMQQNDFRNSERDEDRFEDMRASFGPNESSESDADFMCISTDGQFRIDPSKYGLGPKGLSYWHVTMVNDNRIIRLEKMDYAHGEFIYDISQFTPDIHSKLNNALSDTIGPLQELVTWLINARMMSLRQGLDRHLVVDPSVIDTAGLEARSPIVYVRKGAPRVGIDKFIQQLKITDTTQQNMQEADAMMKLMMAVTGINENAMGQYAPGRRSSAENQAANKGASARMILHVSLFCEQHLSPLGRKMLSNLRQGLSFETFQKIFGQTSPTPGIMLEDIFARFAPEDPRALVGNEDFFVFDLTTGSDKQYTAVALQELISSLTANPQILMSSGYDLTKLIDALVQYRGIKNPNRFKSQQVAAGGTLPAPNGLPADQALGGPQVVPPQLPAAPLQ